MSIFSMDTKSAWNFSSKIARIPSGNSAIFASIFSRSTICLELSTLSSFLETVGTEDSSSTDNWVFPSPSLPFAVIATSGMSRLNISTGKLFFESSSLAFFSFFSEESLTGSTSKLDGGFNSAFFLHHPEAFLKFYVSPDRSTGSAKLQLHGIKLPQN